MLDSKKLQGIPVSSLISTEFLVASLELFGIIISGSPIELC